MKNRYLSLVTWHLCIVFLGINSIFNKLSLHGNFYGSFHSIREKSMQTDTNCISRLLKCHFFYTVHYQLRGRQDKNLKICSLVKLHEFSQVSFSLNVETVTVIIPYKLFAVFRVIYHVTLIVFCC
jgi:hypothetical protein